MFAKILKRIPKPQRLMVFFIPFAFLWILYLAKIQLDLHRLHLDKGYLRERIVELSKEYVKAVAKDRSEKSTPGLKGLCFCFHNTSSTLSLNKFPPLNTMCTFIVRHHSSAYS